MTNLEFERTNRSMLDKALQPPERLVPFRRDHLEISPCVGKSLLFQLPDALAAGLRAAQQPGSLHDAQMFGNRLAADVEAGGQLRNRHGPIVAQTRDQA